MNDEKKILELNLGDILPNRFQPRIKFSEDSINELSESIKEHGVIQPIVVRRIGDKYEIIAGERRYKASVLAGKNVIPAIITDLNDKDSAEVALIENVQRQDLTPIEEAISYKKILDMGYTQEQLAVKLGNKQSTIANKLRLLNLNEEVQEALLDGRISERHARSILRLTNPKQQSEMLSNVINKRLTVRKTDEEIDKMLNSSAPIVDEEVELLDTKVFSNPMTEGSNVSKGVVPMVEEKNNQENIYSNRNIPLSSMEELGKPKVDESSMEIFNIKPIDSIKLPSQPIIEDVKEEKLENPFMEPTPVVPKEEVNPGFMNIDKIENEAKDIFEEKPLADVNSLLEPDPTAPVVVTEEEDDENPEKLLTPGKFFDILNEEPDEEEEKENSMEAFSPNILQPDKTSETTKEDFEEFMNPKVVEIPTIPDNSRSELVFNPFMEEKKVEGKPVVSSVQTVSIPSLGKNLKSAIDLIRDCSKKIEGIGYTVEVEEIDFEDNYQVIFKIIK
ncbi:MAG: ParB/RepB/Spo0J family partition protein [Ignavibacteriales bacterium]